MVISALSFKLANGYLASTGTEVTIFKYLVKFEELLAVAIVIYVMLRYTAFLFSEAERKTSP